MRIQTGNNNYNIRVCIVFGSKGGTESGIENPKIDSVQKINVRKSGKNIIIISKKLFRPVFDICFKLLNKII